MKLLYEPPELPEGAWTRVLEPAAAVDIGPWLAAQLGPRPKQRSKKVTQTARGWDVTFHSYDVDGGMVVIAIYQCFDLTGAIAIGGVDYDWLAAHDLEVAATLRAVEPDWISDEPLAVRDLWTEPLG